MMGKMTKAISKEEIDTILGSIKIKQDVRNALLVELNTGLRIQDIARLRYNDIQFGKLEIIEKKTKKPQITRINMELVEYLFKNRTREDNFIFASNEKEVKAFVRKVQDQILKACDYENIDSTFISTHSFRKSFATLAYNETKDIMFVQQLLNHSSVSVTQKYIRVNKEKADDYRGKQRLGF
ncbi:tyrosine-type recombinase/integrase [Cetobacterium sp. 2G large]|nr:tyrosine-type recombinase/integrase [Cetobacterium sp. 2G large]MBC2852715.1 tyrosine-type recombinase/integrase [Cetobacterium sp. 2G large]